MMKYAMMLVIAGIVTLSNISAVESGGFGIFQVGKTATATNFLLDGIGGFLLDGSSGKLIAQ